MLGRALVAALGGAMVLMLWGAVYWTLLPFGAHVMGGVPDEAAVVAALEAELPGSGVYLVPFVAADRSDRAASVEAFQERHRRGPLIQILYNAGGADPMSTGVLAAGFLNMFTSALIVAGLLVLALPALPAYGQRVLFVFLVGLFAGVAVELAKPVWWHQPWDFWVYQALFPITGWLLVGMAMAAVLKPRSS